MKKITKIITLVAAFALCLFSACSPVVASALLKLAPAENQGYNFTAPTQSNNTFISESVDDYDLSNWTKPSDNYLDSQKVTVAENSKLHDITYPYTTLSNAELKGRTTSHIITTNTKNMPANGCYTTNGISLPANGYYVVEIEYCLKDQTKITNTTGKNAFGTFYLNDRAITLNAHYWHTETFYIHTDLLEKATITPELYFGSRDEKALGAIYFSKFTINAVNEAKFKASVFNNDNSLKIKPNAYIDFSKNDEYRLVKAFTNSDFHGNNYTSGASDNDVSVANIPGRLGFSDTQHYFYNKDGSTSASVMLLEANNNNPILELNNYTLEPKPHEVYMLQFYSIATAASDFTGFYFNIIPTENKENTSAHNVVTITGDKYHNGWQLNTIFFVAGYDLHQSYNFSFRLASGSEKATGWACIDDFKIYQVSGDYAANNASSTGVHDTYDLNKDTEPDIANAYFDLGTASKITQTTYPYPLKATSWLTNIDDNGIVNIDNNLWHETFGANPGKFNTNNNNNIYMMRNNSARHNVLVSPALTTTAGETAHITFDAYSNPTSKTKVNFVTASTNDEGNLVDVVVLGSLNINAGKWEHYSFNINENTYAANRSYYLQFIMDGIGYTYIDNVNKPDQAATAGESDTIDLANPLTVDTIWRTDTTAELIINNGKLTAQNTDGRKTVIENSFAYNLTKDSYYEFTINAQGNDAYFSLKGYDGLLAVDSNDASEYKLYVKAGDSTTPTFQITLGSNQDETNNIVGKLTINSIEVKTVEEADFNSAKENSTIEGSHKLCVTQTEANEEETTTETEPEDNSFFGQNWWYLIPTLITAIATLLAITAFLLRKIKFEKHITKKHTSYARDMRMKNQQNKIVAQKAAKVDNISNESQSN